MSLPRGLWISISLSCLLVGSTALAEGHGKGLNRALSAAARGAGSSGLARAAQGSNRSGSGLSKGGAKLGRSANGLNRASSGMSHSQAIAAKSTNAARIRDNRMEQADHLREVSAQNGNARLLDTADRMQNSALTNFDRRTDGATATGRQSPGTNDSAADTTLGTSRPTPPAQPAKNPRASWLPSWLGKSR